MATKAKKRQKRSPRWLTRALRIVGLFLLFVVALTALLRFVPVPFSAYMAQQQLGHWLTGDFAFKTRYDWVSLDRISKPMQLAVIAAEDQQFPSHFGIDWQAVEKAYQHNQASARVRGGSTISQQTAKNLYLWHGQSWLRKGLEVPTTWLLETLWDKNRILEVYLNIAEFGDGIYGVEAAAQHFFNTSAAKLTNAQAALLASSLPNPHIYRVDAPSQAMLRKQQWILRQMQALGGKPFLQRLE
ncbi:monofunctional biosynthetic peptidoglycan transglycosylase [Pasteurellaceae bacterium 20609_3]|uniref:monofunctional biosynthetic peptidoglycan transglycosylase n=1 Tax=Spirabiliibacterium mucosae TaxID=28156 RepID=UPI001AAD9C2A|nr:monofunctional biosynthetic peptidoglycan transglycosylase [Spirabiliibacterium mucosae]MBE2898140.1 monofunctional biosynthetic peptidoglycan transglycosylase [Spirabiliibacterium mucosae]